MPAVARARGALDGGRRVARDPERRMRLLDGRWAGPHRRQAVARAREVGVAAAPERPADREVLLGPPAAPGKRHAERLELLAEPAGARGEDYTATREDVERGDLLRRDHGVAIRDDVRADAQPHAAGLAGEIGEGDRRLEEALDDAQVAGPRIGPTVVRIDRASGARGDEVVAHPDGVDAERFRLAGEADEHVGRGERSVVGERDAEAHAGELPEGGPAAPVGAQRLRRRSRAVST